MDLYNYIYDPITRKQHFLSSKEGKLLLNDYIKYGGSTKVDVKEQQARLSEVVLNQPQHIVKGEHGDDDGDGDDPKLQQEDIRNENSLGLFIDGFSKQGSLNFGTGTLNNPKYIMSTWDSIISKKKNIDNYGLFDVLRKENGVEMFKNLFLIDNNDLYKKQKDAEDSINERNEIYVLLVGAIQADQFLFNKKGDKYFYPLSPNITKKAYNGHNISSIIVDETGLIVDYAFNHNELFSSSLEHAESRAIRRAMTNLYTYKHLLNRFESKNNANYNSEKTWWMGNYKKDYEKVKMTKKLMNCSLYSSLESCAQCSGIMALARMDRVTYLMRDTGYFNIGNIIHNLTKGEALAAPKPIFSFNYTYTTCLLALTFELTWLLMSKLSDILKKFYKNLNNDEQSARLNNLKSYLDSKPEIFDEKELLVKWQKDILNDNETMLKIETLIGEFNLDIKNNSIKYLNKIYKKENFSDILGKYFIRFELVKSESTLSIKLINQYVNFDFLKEGTDPDKLLSKLQLEDEHSIKPYPIYINKKNGEFSFIGAITDYLITDVCYQIYDIHRKILEYKFKSIDKDLTDNDLFKIKSPDYKNLMTRTWTENPTITDEKFVLTNKQVLLECYDFYKFVQNSGFRGTVTGNI